MRIRHDSPFYGITEEQKELLLEEASELSYMRVSELWEKRSGKDTSESQVKRFIQRLRYERAIRETDDSDEDLAAFAKRAVDGKARDGLIEAARQKLFEEALAKNDRGLLLELYKAANEERAREREIVVEQRKARAAEEKVKIGWLKVAGGRQILEAQMTSSEAVIDGGGAAEPKLLPFVREVLADESRNPADRIAVALEVLAKGEYGGEVKLLAHATGENEHARLEAGVPGEGTNAAPPLPTIDWGAPLREFVASKPFAHLYTKEQLEEFAAQSANDNAPSEDM